MNDVAGVPDNRAAYAGFWRRFAAWAIDWSLILIGGYAFRLVAELAGVGDRQHLTLVILGGYLLYCATLESSSWQATLGKRALGIKVMNRRGERIGFTRAAARFVAKLLSMLTMFLGFLLVVVTRRRQALHDLIAGTLVALDGTQRRPAWVVAPLAAVGSVPFVAVLAAIALPAYQDMTIRAQVSEGLNLAAAPRAAIESAWRDSQRDFARVSSDSLGAGLPGRGRYVESIEVVSGMIMITYGNEANEVLSGSVLTLVPAVDAKGTLGWVCGYGPAPAGFEVAYENPAGYTTIDERYVPSACRSTVP
ncbi:MAG TPA: RDD family protein [Rhodanobacteraceae bacterium]|nr:RDD family protein [Rhodanobacteraceae bacterium]